MSLTQNFWLGTDPDSNFSNPGSWSLGHVPNSTENATINASGVIPPVFADDGTILGALTFVDGNGALYDFLTSVSVLGAVTLNNVASLKLFLLSGSMSVPTETVVQINEGSGNVTILGNGSSNPTNVTFGTDFAGEIICDTSVGLGHQIDLGGNSFYNDNFTMTPSTARFRNWTCSTLPNRFTTVDGGIAQNHTKGSFYSGTYIGFTPDTLRVEDPAPGSTVETGTWSWTIPLDWNGSAKDVTVVLFDSSNDVSILLDAIPFITSTPDLATTRSAQQILTSNAFNHISSSIIKPYILGTNNTRDLGINVIRSFQIQDYNKNYSANVASGVTLNLGVDGTIIRNGIVYARGHTIDRKTL
jgi:hypothetical protein